MKKLLIAAFALVASSTVALAGGPGHGPVGCGCDEVVALGTNNAPVVALQLAAGKNLENTAAGVVVSVEAPNVNAAAHNNGLVVAAQVGVGKNLTNTAIGAQVVVKD